MRNCLPIFRSFHPFDSFVCRNDRFDGAVFVEFHLVDTYFAVYARLVFDVILIDAVIYNVPFVFTGNL